MKRGHPLQTGRDFIAALRQARQIGGKSYPRQVREILWCKRNLLHFGTSDYFDQRLFDSHQDYAAMASYAGWRMESWLDDQLNPVNWRGLAEDKLATYAILDSVSIPYPRILSLFHAQSRSYKDAPTLTSAEALANHLRDEATYPCFVKPIFGAVGGGAASLIEFDRSRDSVVLGSGERIPVMAFCQRLEQPKPGVVVRAGYLFQELVDQHPELRTRCAQAVSTLRIVIVLSESGPVIHRSDWRVSVGKNMTDNYDKGRSGNLLASIDPETGTVRRLSSGSGLSQRLLERHPDTETRITGTVLPDWGKLRQTCLAAARAFPMLGFQHWDVALSSRGPKILELNTTGGIGPSQCMADRGLYDGALREAIERAGAA